MLLNLFDGHPELCVYPTDITMLYAYFPAYENGGFSEKEKRERLNTVIFDTLEGESNIAEHLDLGSLRSRFSERMGSKSYATGDILKELVLAYYELVGPSHLDHKGTIVKETSIEIYARHLFEWFPDAKFIHLIRDPRDTFAALKAGIEGRYRHFGDDANTIIHSLLERCHLGMEMADLNQQRFGTGSYKIVRFEDLVTSPDTSLRDMCEFLGISYQESLMVPTLLGNPTRGNNFEKMDFSRISTRNVGAWPGRILPDEAKVIEFHFSDLMPRFQYETAFSDFEQSDAAADFYKWSNHKYHHFDHLKCK
jgi:hypothetical protein